MKIRLFRPVLTSFAMLMIFCSLAISVSAAAFGAGAATDISITIDAIAVSSEVSAVNLSGTTYVSISEFSRKLGAQTVTSHESVLVLDDGLRVEASLGDVYIIANGRYLYVPDGVRLFSGECYAPIRILSQAFGASVSWIAPTHTVSVYSGDEPISPPSYSQTDLYWMSRIIFAESRGESFTGKLAVGNVIMNRVSSSAFPNTVYDVVFDRRSGIQFTPAYSGAIYNTPDSECVVAAKLALDGANVVGDSLYFSQSYLSCWAARNRPFNTTIGGHSFYF